MSSRISLWVGLIGIAATIPLVQSIASAKTSVEIADTATAITVLITEPNNVGSGVILQRQGDIYTVLTAAHVVKNKVSYKITTPDNRSSEVISSSIRSAPDSIDLAVVKFKSITKYPTAKLGNCNLLKLGMDLYVAGFPATTKAIPESTFVFMSGKVAANSNKVAENGYSLIYNNITQPGMSGGAVLNSDGELVAIHGRGDRDEDSRKTGLNLGIPINRFAMVANNMGVELGGQVAAIPQNPAPKADDYIASAAQKRLNRDYRGAVADLDRAIQLDPNNATTYVDRSRLKTFDAVLVGAKRDYWGALADYNRAIQLNPNFSKAYFSLGDLKVSRDFDNIRKRDFHGGIADFKQAARLAKQQQGIAVSRQDTYGENISSLDYVEATAALDSTYSEEARIKEDSGDCRGAIEYYNQITSPDLRSRYISQALCKYKIKDYSRAIVDLSRWIAIDSTSHNAYMIRGHSKYKLEDYSGAISDYKQALSIYPKYASAYFNLGLVKAKQNDLKGAISDMQQAVKLYQQEGKQQDAQDAMAQIKQWQQTSQSSGF